MATFYSIANKARKFYGLILMTRKALNADEEFNAAHKETEATLQGLDPSIRIKYVFRREKSIKAQGATYFYTLKAAEEHLARISPKFNICKRCLVEMKRLDTCEGDPEGLRHDSKCSKCEDVYGCTRSSQTLLRTKYGSSDPKWKPLVEGDPVNFTVGSNWVRSTIALLRNNKDAGPSVLRHVAEVERLFDGWAKNHRETVAEAIKDGDMAG